MNLPLRWSGSRRARSRQVPNCAAYSIAHSYVEMLDGSTITILHDQHGIGVMQVAFEDDAPPGAQTARSCSTARGCARTGASAYPRRRRRPRRRRGDGGRQSSFRDHYELRSPHRRRTPPPAIPKTLPPRPAPPTPSSRVTWRDIPVGSRPVAPRAAPRLPSHTATPASEAPTAPRKTACWTQPSRSRSAQRACLPTAPPSLPSDSRDGCRQLLQSMPDSTPTIVPTTQLAAAHFRKISGDSIRVPDIRPSARATAPVRIPARACPLF